jgi:hypothetical protein
MNNVSKARPVQTKLYLFVLTQCRTESRYPSPIEPGHALPDIAGGRVMAEPLRWRKGITRACG